MKLRCVICDDKTQLIKPWEADYCYKCSRALSWGTRRMEGELTRHPAINYPWLITNRFTLLK